MAMEFALLTVHIKSINHIFNVA